MQTQFDTEAQLIQEVSNNPGVIRTYLEACRSPAKETR